MSSPDVALKTATAAMGNSAPPAAHAVRYRCHPSGDMAMPVASAMADAARHTHVSRKSGASGLSGRRMRRTATHTARDSGTLAKIPWLITPACITAANSQTRHAV